ncbi:UbiA family prenyltransferase [Variovorax sp. W6]|uniref:UbiA family prenyltransferase n=1 Tax=Variovorax sp. W6 TaxID=3093895 RepID=UPI003D803C32
MIQRDVEPVAAPARLASLRRLLSCIRVDEVCVLQGAPVIGACFAMTDFSMPTLLAIAALVAGNLLLVAHVFVLNDWSGIHGDLRDPTRAGGTYVAKGENSARMGSLALALLALSLLIFALVGRTSFAIALAIAALSALYSLQGGIHGKGVPLLSSLLHLCGGTLHFLLGYAALSPISPHSAAIGCYFGLVFAAGHLTHETRDHEGDLRNGIRTNAVMFGKKGAFLAGLLLFSAAYMLLATLALLGLVPRVLLLSILLYVIHLRAAWRTLREGLTYPGIRRLQTVYRNIHAVIGLTLLLTLPPW